MTTKLKYKYLVDSLNEHIDSFNHFLSEDFKLKRVLVDDPACFAESIVEGQPKPSQAQSGVYVLCACHETEGTIGAYIGKASLSQIGHRLWHHLKVERETGIYRFRKGPFRVEAIVAIPMVPPMGPSMATALEEHIISKGLRTVKLLNTIGKRSGGTDVATSTSTNLTVET